MQKLTYKEPMFWLARFLAVVLPLLGQGPFPHTRAALGGSVAEASRQASGSGDAPRASTRQGEAQLAQRSVHRPGTFVPLLQVEGGEVFHVISDHLGTPKELVDEAGRVAWSAAHGAWNQIQEQWFDDAHPRSRCVASPFRGLGQYYDAETQLSCTRYRYWEAGTGRWLSGDPLGILGGTNLFGFDGVPNLDIDPLGLCKARNPKHRYGTKNDGTPRAKPGPKPNGPHNDKIEEVIQRKVAEGHTHVAGGIYRDKAERTIPTPGGHKDARRPDATFRDKDTGEVFHYNVCRRNQRAGSEANSVDPIVREREALQDLRDQGETVFFEPYDP